MSSVAALAIETLVFTFRVLAGTMSLIGLVNWWSFRKKDEFPPYDRVRNERAWNWAYAGLAVAATSFIALDLTFHSVRGSTIADICVAVVWWCWANAVTVRLSSKAARPKYVYYAATIFIVAGFTYAFATAP